MPSPQGKGVWPNIRQLACHAFSSPPAPALGRIRLPADPGYNRSVQALYFPDRAAAEIPDRPRIAPIVPCRPDIRRVTSAFSGNRTSDVFPLRPPNRHMSYIQNFKRQSSSQTMRRCRPVGGAGSRPVSGDGHSGWTQWRLSRTCIDKRWVFYPGRRTWHPDCYHKKTCGRRRGISALERLKEGTPCFT
jgi:hypothetical protein